MNLHGVKYRLSSLRSLKHSNCTQPAFGQNEASTSATRDDIHDSLSERHRGTSCSNSSLKPLDGQPIQSLTTGALDT